MYSVSKTNYFYPDESQKLLDEKQKINIINERDKREIKDKVTIPTKQLAFHEVSFLKIQAKCHR